ncbi:MAG: response regulator [Phycisphaerae bacterium]|nr:response regulator [Phycisphaerae bacterium]
MDNKTVILVAEDDRGHYELVKRNLWLTCVNNEILNFRDGQELLDFLFEQSETGREKDTRYILLLDIRMPKVDGYEVLRRIKEDPYLRAMPIIMLTTTNDTVEIDRCYQLGCNFYMVKPVNYNKFMQAVEGLGSFLSLEGIIVPRIEKD